jgi:hypothetical protein
MVVYPRPSDGGIYYPYFFNLKSNKMATKKSAPAVELKERVYVLTGGISPVNYILRSRHTTSKPLQYFDEEKNVFRSMRFSSNQTSIFEDEQYGDVSLPAIVFNNGKLVVRREDTLLQDFLSKHPDNGKIFVEFDPEKKAEEELATVEAELEAMNLARQMDIEDLEAIARAVLRSSVNSMTSKEIKRDMLIYAKNNPEEFIRLANDENIKLRNAAVRAVEMGIIKILDDKRTVSWNSGKKEKIVTVPYGENVYSALAAYFKTDEGLDVLQGITNKL